MGLGAASQRGLNGLVKTKSLDASIGRPDFSGSYLIKPDSVTYSGTSAYIADSGQIIFTSITSLSINGCFGPEFNNYVILCQLTEGGANTGWNYMLRSGTTNASGANYTRQRIYATSTTIGANRSTGQTSAFFAGTGTLTSGFALYMYGPYLSQPTSSRSIVIRGAGTGVEIDETVATHSLSSSYDGWTMEGNTSSGSLQVYGVLS